MNLHQSSQNGSDPTHPPQQVVSTVISVRYWETVERLRINQFYGAPTALRLLLKYNDSWVRKYDRSSLRTLGSVGEPINHEAWHWFHSVVGEGRCPLVDTWWQTETGGVCIAPHPADHGAPIIPAMAMRPFFGIQPVLMGEKVRSYMQQYQESSVFCPTCLCSDGSQRS
ncbi:Acetyl-coenzyme A synthetase 2-like, mitochondrial [Ataeniobius toweri]|uniref:acetate--CoA ligase n=1 Tax=Ataeniobius toweri TaxID=208326 RepID=A0ABU7C0L2_9TELE|nr:Acetyl-coenzyme A synthetase 2-like, mitochondrial [Ataeniobius toweri]